MWIKPKTDWNGGKDEFINKEDYNRIKNNIVEIQNQIMKIYQIWELIPMGEDKNYSSDLFPDEFNRIEDALHIACQKTFPFEIGTKKQFYENKPVIDYVELNRIENACRIIHDNLVGQKIGAQRLAFNLGRRRYP